MSATTGVGVPITTNLQEAALLVVLQQEKQSDLELLQEWWSESAQPEHFDEQEAAIRVLRQGIRHGVARVCLE